MAERVDLAKQLAGKLEEAILSGQLPVGMLLPSEREISQRLEIGRGVVREAINRLTGLGLVQTHDRSGTRVEPASRKAVEIGYHRLLRQADTDLRQLNAVRLVLEPGIAELAAQNRSNEHLERMSRSQAVLRKADSTLEDHVNADLEFHMALADATGNPLFDVLLVPIQKLLIENHVRTIRQHGTSCTVQEHQDILDAVRARKPANAAEAMRAHLNSVIHHVNQLLTEPQPAPQSGISVWALTRDFFKSGDSASVLKEAQNGD